MGRILAIDYGLKRTGIAVTDPLKIIATPLETVLTKNLLSWLKEYTSNQAVETIVLGFPTKPDQSHTDSTDAVIKFSDHLVATFPDLQIVREDERFTSKMAQQSMVAGGMKKKDRRIKGNVDKISAAIILQSYLERTTR